jgi:hypothetical protein
MRRIGVAKSVPSGPHSQVQNAIERNIANGLSVNRRPITLGVMNWPSSVLTATISAGASNAWANVGSTTNPTTNTSVTTAAGPKYGT